ncbi:AMP-binding protein [Streptomyces sp. 3MP-14]|uniref:AMP-binding protein n=1 Tax=Streptomyces mimosae TaxID=2586635 RepID=A0A5N6A2K2_9ACTN|nr:AMP-binding protein [Streptomyces mimosae]KAB8173976.1 AMP-binding protein [Streptomyces sp. 3MP-14]
MSSLQRPLRAGARELSPSHLQLLLSRVSQIPSLRDKYLSTRDGPRQPLTLATLPVLTRNELVAATDELLRGKGPGEGSVVYAGGGTVSRPSMSLLPGGLFVEEVHQVWRALRPGDVLANFFPAGREWATHSFYNRFATHSGASLLPVGDLPEDEFDRWLTFCADYGANALAAPPHLLRRLLRHRAAGHQLPWLRKLLIGGAFHDRTPLGEIGELLPDVAVWQLYGSAEAWLVGHRGPRCAEGVFHLLPHQYAEIDEGRLLITTVGADEAPPLIRYVIGDRGAVVDCPCDRPGTAVRVLDAIGPALRFQGGRVWARELVELALETAEVAGAQVAVVMGDGETHLELRVRLADGVPDDQYTREWIRHRALHGHLALDPTIAEDADRFHVVTVDRLHDCGRAEPPPLVVACDGEGHVAEVP